MANTSGLLLTGGRSRRLGADKARLVVGGRTLAAHGADLLTGVCDVVVEVGPGVTTLPTALEDPPGAGPLAALAAGAAALAHLDATGAATIVLACDLPRATRELLLFLRDRPGAPTVVPSVAGRVQPVCARYGTDALAAAAALVARGESSLRALLAVVDHDVVHEDEWGAVAGADTFADIDTPSDAARYGIEVAPRPSPAHG